jgi:hypothetical protein
MKTTESICRTGGVSTSPGLAMIGKAYGDDWEIQLRASLDAPCWMPRGSTVAADDKSGIQVVTLPILPRLI